MSSSRSSSNKSNRSTTYDQRTTESINAGIGGDIGDESTVVSGVRGDVNLRTSTTDHGAVDAAEDIANEGIAVASEAVETVGDSQEDALDFGEEALAGVIDFGGDALSTNAELVETVLEANAEQQTEVLDSADKLTELSLTNLAAIKSGETIAKAADRNLLEMKNGLIIVAGITAAAVVGSKFIAVGDRK